MEQRFDGVEVAVFEGKFTGTCDIPHSVGAGMGIFDDEEYVFKVVVTPKSANFGETKTGDPKRTNTLQVLAVEYEGRRAPVAISVEPKIGIDSLDGQITVDEALEEALENLPDEVISTPPPPASERQPEPEPVDDREPIPVGSGGPVRDYSGDPALKAFLES